MFGYLALNSAITALVEGLIILEVKIPTFPFDRRAFMDSSVVFQVTSFPLISGPRKRAPSYKPKTDA